MKWQRKVVGGVYRRVVKPILFRFDAEWVHDQITNMGEALENIQWPLTLIFGRTSPELAKTLLGVKYQSPIGLAAGFDYDGHMAQVLKNVGFGFNTVGTVTARSYAGNPKPRLGRLPKSQSLLVNKGFKSSGADEVAKRLDSKNLSGHTVGVSVGSSNSPEVNTVIKAINDYLYTLRLFKEKPYVKYFELNISCPNTAMTESFINPANFTQLVKAVKKIKLRQPVYIKMPNEITLKKCQEIVDIGVKNGVVGYIFSNLVKDRNNPAFVPEELGMVQNLKGNFSGKPTEANSNRLIKSMRKRFGKKIVIIGCGGVFSPEDALAKISAGADLIQMISGMIFQGPQVIGEINDALSGEMHRR